MIGLDTSAIIDIFRGDEKIKKFLENNKEPLVVSIINYLELFFGLDIKYPKYLDEIKFYKGFFDDLYNFDLTKESCEITSEIFQELKRKGKLIEQFDCIIAAIFITNGVNKILTRNVKHFENIKELNVISY